MHTTTAFLLASLFMLPATPTVRASGPDDPAVIDRDDQRVMSSAAFLNAHPDMKYRHEGWLAYSQGDHAAARTHFLEAAAWGDKPSQAMLAEMAWQGLGQPADPALGYAWADLAAERGYRPFVALREQYWRQLDGAAQARAVEAGQPLLATYADEVTGPRMARHLRRQRFGMISMRPRKDVAVSIPGPGGQWLDIRGHDFYVDKFWEPARYRAWVDAVWTDPPKENVDVGAPQSLEAPR